MFREHSKSWNELQQALSVKTPRSLKTPRNHFKENDRLERTRSRGGFPYRFHHPA